MDEEYPGRPESTYSVLKFLEGQLAGQLCRWDPRLKMIGLRFSNVMDLADYQAFPGFNAEPRARKWNLWGYIDARDGAQAVRLALEHQANGVDIFIIANADTMMSRSTASFSPRSSRTCRCAARSASTTPCCRSTRLVESSAINRATAGGTKSSFRSEPLVRSGCRCPSPPAGVRGMLSSGLGRGGVPELATRR